MKKIWDISPRISADSPVWPGDTQFSNRRVMSMSDGDAVNVGTMETTVHIGAHADAPVHFLENGASVADSPLEPYLGPCRVVERIGNGPIMREELESKVEGVERVLVRTRSDQNANPFEQGFASLHPDAAAWIAARGIQLVGLDTPSVDEFDSKDMASHLALLARGVAILENLDLSQVPEGDYELIALPLPLEGMDASPVRAVLRELGE
jgi:arylformamidase